MTQDPTYLHQFFFVKIAIKGFPNQPNININLFSFLRARTTLFEQHWSCTPVNIDQGRTPCLVRNHLCVNADTLANTCHVKTFVIIFPKWIRLLRIVNVLRTIIIAPATKRNIELLFPTLINLYDTKYPTRIIYLGASWTHIPSWEFLMPP